EDGFEVLGGLSDPFGRYLGRVHASQRTSEFVGHRFGSQALARSRCAIEQRRRPQTALGSVGEAPFVDEGPADACQANEIMERLPDGRRHNEMLQTELWYRALLESRHTQVATHLQ